MTSGQREVLNALTDGPQSTLGIKLVFGVTKATTLRRLEDRDLIRRTYPSGSKVIWWELTHAGRSVLDLTAPASEGKGA